MEQAVFTYDDLKKFEDVTFMDPEELQFCILDDGVTIVDDWTSKNGLSRAVVFYYTDWPEGFRFVIFDRIGGNYQYFWNQVGPSYYSERRTTR